MLVVLMTKITKRYKKSESTSNEGIDDEEKNEVSAMLCLANGKF